ncbi:hypothetical protein HG15A2_19640 [Adhaeretor mobilis]|uniref:Uncharacterized protein n=1 Tax=Adhaeretor mobilis TaxID=1930276 RepID=A0A517MUX6_9BACT|nr:hypothetical protein HG15A2_19640 [Adhaeretor mobilis]
MQSWRKTCTIFGLGTMALSASLHLWWKYRALQDSNWFFVPLVLGIIMVFSAARYQRAGT